MTRRSYTSAGRKTTNQPMVNLDFDLDDITWECEGDISILDLSEYARLAAQGVDSESAEGLAILADVYSGLLGKDYQKFRSHCRRHGTDGETLVAILQGLITESSDRPTSRPSDSSDGPQNDQATSTVVSFSRATTEQIPVEQPQEERQLVSYG